LTECIVICWFVLDIVIQQAWMIWKLYLLGRKNNEHGKG